MNKPFAITLIGMPGAGKSTLGKELARRLGLPFIDTDHRIEKMEGCTLQTLLDREGVAVFRAKEAAALTSLKKQACVIATGGSAVYSAAGMQHLSEFTTVVWLQVELETIYERINQGCGRGIARGADQDLAQLLGERTPLYRKTADLTVSMDHRPVHEVAEELCCLIRRHGV